MTLLLLLYIANSAEITADFADYNATWFALLHVIERLRICNSDGPHNSVVYFSNTSVGGIQKRGQMFETKTGDSFKNVVSY